MPIIKSAAKRMRQNQTRYRHNLHYKRAMREEVKTFNEAVAGGDEKTASAHLHTAQKAIDKALKHGIIHANTASRKKSQLARYFNRTFGEDKAAPPKPAEKTPTTKSTTKKTSATSGKKAAAKPASKSTAKQSPRSKK